MGDISYLDTLIFYFLCLKDYFGGRYFHVRGGGVNSNFLVSGDMKQSESLNYVIHL